MSPRPSHPGLELLIRKRGSGGSGPAFEIKVFQADRAFLRLRPRRRSDRHLEINEIEEAMGKVFVVHLVDEARHLRLTEHEYRIWERMDGRHTIQDLATALVFEFGRFDFDEIRQALGKLRGAGLVEVRPSSLLRARAVPGVERVQSLARALAEYDHRWEDADATFRRAHRLLRPLFTRPAMVVHLVLGAVGVVVYLGNRWTGAMTPTVLPQWAWAALFALLAPLFIALHELAHGVACKAHGRRVRAVGVSLLDYLLPSVYVDVTDMYMSSRMGRIIVALAGPLSNLVMAAAATLVAMVASDPSLTAVAVTVADVNLALALFTGWPFHGLQEDGYDALSEVLRTTLLRRRAGALVAATLRRRPPVLEVPRRAAMVYLVGLVATWLVMGGLISLWLWRAISQVTVS